MNLADDIQPVTCLKSHAAQLLQQVNETRRPVIITQNGQARGVLQDPASYESTRNTIALLKLMVQGEEDVRGGRVVDQDTALARVKARLTAKSAKKS